MKKKALQKALGLVLAGAMVIGTLAGCGSKENTSATPEPASEPAKEESTEAGTQAASTEAAAGGGVESWTPFESNVTLKVPVYDRGVEGVPTVNDNYWTKWIQENFGDKYNITVEFVPITRTDVMTDYALLAASEDLPTILMEYDYPKVTKWAADGYLTTYDLDAFAEVAPTYYNRMVENGQLDYAKMGDEIYFALAERPYSDTNYSYINFCRMDWLEEVGYDHIPMTRAEYLDAMKKIQEAGIAEHPGQDSMVTGVGSDQNYKYREFPIDETEWAMYGDVNIPPLSWEPTRKILKEKNEDYNNGINDPEYYITDIEAEKARFINGEQWRYGGYIAPTMDFLESFYKQNPDAKLAVMPVDVLDEENGTTPAYRATNPFGMIIGFSSFASEDEIKAAWMYMEWMTQEDVLFDMQWGVEGENYTMDEATGLPVSVADYDGEYKQGFSNNKDYWCVTLEARNAGTIEDLIKASAPQGLPQDFTQDIIDFYYAQVDLAEQGYACRDALFSVEIAADTEYSGTLVELYKEYRDKLTMCKPEEFDALYEQYSQEFLDAGFQEIIDERKAAYENNQSTKLPDNAKK